MTYPEICKQSLTKVCRFPFIFNNLHIKTISRMNCEFETEFEARRSWTDEFRYAIYSLSSALSSWIVIISKSSLNVTITSFVRPRILTNESSSSGRTFLIRTFTLSVKSKMHELFSKACATGRVELMQCPLWSPMITVIFSCFCRSVLITLVDKSWMPRLSSAVPSSETSTEFSFYSWKCHLNDFKNLICNFTHFHMTACFLVHFKSRNVNFQVSLKKSSVMGT